MQTKLSRGVPCEIGEHNAIIRYLHTRSLNEQQKLKTDKWSQLTNIIQKLTTVLFICVRCILFLGLLSKSILLKIQGEKTSEVVIRVKKIWQTEAQKQTFITCKWLFKWYSVKPFNPINLSTDLGVASVNPRPFHQTSPCVKQKMTPNAKYSLSKSKWTHAKFIFQLSSLPPQVNLNQKVDKHISSNRDKRILQFTELTALTWF